MEGWGGVLCAPPTPPPQGAWRSQGLRRRGLRGVVRTLLEASTTHSKPQTANSQSQGKHRDALRAGKESRAGSSKTLGETDSFPPLSSVLSPRSENRGVTGPGDPWVHLVTPHAAPEMAAVGVRGGLQLFHAEDAPLGTGNAPAGSLRGGGGASCTLQVPL